MEFDIHFIGAVLDVLGKIAIAFAALRVHHRVLHEHSIDKWVFNTMKREQLIGVAGVLLILAGFILEHLV